MISILPLNNKKPIAFSKSKQVSNSSNPVVDSILSSTNIKNAKALAQQGSEYLKNNQLDKAIDAFKKSIDLRPEYQDTYFELGKSYKRNNDYDNAITTLETYINGKPSDVDAIILLGESYNSKGSYSKAIDQYSKATMIDPENDLAKRNLAEAKNNMLACYDPTLAANQKREQSINNLKTSLSMAKKYLPTGYLKDMGDLTIAFDKTAKLGGTSNIAQYEHSKRKVTVSEDYVYAAPEIITAYLVHEFVHAKDKDGYTSIREEQDAYRKQIEFWVKNSNGVADPELDYAGNLYNDSPQTLDSRVAEIYRLRDPDIANISPNHPPSNKRVANTPISEMNSGQPLKSYDVIS